MLGEFTKQKTNAITMRALADAAKVLASSNPIAALNLAEQAWELAIETRGYVSHEERMSAIDGIADICDDCISKIPDGLHCVGAHTECTFTNGLENLRGKYKFLAKFGEIKRFLVEQDARQIFAYSEDWEISLESAFKKWGEEDFKNYGEIDPSH